MTLRQATRIVLLMIVHLLTGNLYGQQWPEAGTGAEGAAPREVVEIDRTWKLTGRTEVPGARLTREGDRAIYDFGGRSLLWVGKGKCNQKEGQPEMFVLEDNVTLRNAVIEGAPDGVHVTGRNVTIENCAWPGICEDAVSVNEPRVRNLTIDRCYFAGAEDKAIQLNHGKRILIRNNVFRFTSTAIRAANEPRDVQITGNVFLGCDVCIHLSGGDVDDVRITGNEFRDAGVFLRMEDDARAWLEGGNRGNATNETLQVRDGARLKGRE